MLLYSSPGPRARNYPMNSFISAIILVYTIKKPLYMTCRPVHNKVRIALHSTFNVYVSYRNTSKQWCHIGVTTIKKNLGHMTDRSFLVQWSRQMSYQNIKLFMIHLSPKKHCGSTHGRLHLPNFVFVSHDQCHMTPMSSDTSWRRTSGNFRPTPRFNGRHIKNSNHEI